MSKVVLFGNGPVAEVAFSLLKHDSPHEIVACTVDAEYIENNKFNDLPILPFEEIEQKYPPNDFKMFLPISYQKVNELRKQKYTQAKEKGYSCISYISSKAITFPDLSVGENCFILEANVIQPFVKIGNNVVLWSGNHIGHHSEIKDHCFLASHIVVSGNVVIDEKCFIGVNATLTDNITIGRKCVIGAGALILKNTKEKQVFLGPKATLYIKTADDLFL